MSARRAEAATTPTAQKPKGLLHYIGLALSGALLVIVIAIALLAIVIPAVSGGSALTVLTQSMEPKLPPGTLIIIHPVKPVDIRVGNVITYQIKSNQPEVVSHRVISKSTDTHGDVTFITKGDNNSLADTPAVRPVQIRGVLWYSIPWLGYVNTLSGGGGARAILIPVVAGLLLIYAAYMVVSSIVGSRRKRFAAAVAAASGPVAPVEADTPAAQAGATPPTALPVAAQPVAAQPVSPPLAAQPVVPAERYIPVDDAPPSAEFLEWARQKWATREQPAGSDAAVADPPADQPPVIRTDPDEPQRS